MPADPLTISAVLALVTKEALEALAGKVSEELWKKLQGDPAQKAFAQALGIAMSRYTLLRHRPRLHHPLGVSQAA
jgi:hypothetical protein